MDATASGTVIVVQVSIKPGIASTFKPMTEDEAIAYDNDLVLLLLT